MNPIRERVKEHVPAVLLTLLSIVQALALELLWGRVHELDELYEATWLAATLWAQMSGNFVGIVVIWVVYVSTVMRFRWVPGIGDIVYPFVIGVAEFMLIDASRTGFLGAWFLEMAFIFAVMNGVSHQTLRRARLEPENERFFRRVAPATLRDFYPAIATVAALVVLGLFFLFFETPAQASLAAVLAVNLLLLLQLYNVKGFWERTFQGAD